MRVMNGRLHNLNHGSSKERHHHHRHKHKGNGGGMNNVPLRRRSSDAVLPKSVQFDESSDSYRCLCGCFHVKTGAFCIAGIEMFLMLCYFINAVLVLLQQRGAYGSGRTNGNVNTIGDTENEYMYIAFIAISVSLAIALITIILMIVGLTRNIASLLIPHILAQAVSILCFTGLLIIGAVALFTDSAFFYRLLNATPFNDYPGQSTVAFSTETMVHVYIVLALYALSLVLELWFIVIIYNCNRYFTERRTYMNYCLAYSTPMKTLNSAR